MAENDMGMDWELGYSSYWDNKVEEDKSPSGSLAIDVLNTYGIPVDLTEVKGGVLSGIDIKSMDAINVIKASLLEQTAKDGKLYDLIITGEGEARIIEVGEGKGPTDIYYSLPTHSYKTDVAGVVVSGGKPLPKRGLAEPFDLLTNAVIWDTSSMYPGACKVNGLKQYCTITYDDPHLTTQYKDGIDNAFDINVPFRKLIGYVYKIDYGLSTDKDVKVAFSSQASVPIQVNADISGNRVDPDLGELVEKKISIVELGNCWAAGQASEGGVPVPRFDSLRYEDIRHTVIDKYIGISKVIIIGTKLNRCKPIPTNKKAGLSNTTENNELWIGYDYPSDDAIELAEGEHYVINYIDDVPHIKFADSSKVGDNFKYGNKVTARLHPNCGYYADASEDEKTINDACILPTGGGKGILVKDIWVQVDLNSPAINIYDPLGRAVEIAKDITATVTAMYIDEPEAPVAFNGVSLDLTDGIADNDPTTKQDFQDTDTERVMKLMGTGSGINLQLSSLSDPADVERLSKTLQKSLESDNGVVTTYICGPDCEVELGSTGPAGGIVNNVTYSYIDKQSYTISVSEGARFVGNSTGMSGTPYFKAQGQVSGRGTIIQDEGNQVMFKVLIDGVGVKEAINCCHDILRIGDRVSVTIHNHLAEVD